MLDDARVALAKWIAEYYVAPIFDSVALMLPPGFERRPITILRSLVDGAEIAGLELSPRQREVLEAIARRPSIELGALREHVSFSAIEPLVAQLERREFITRDYALHRPRVGEKTVEVASLTVSRADAEALVARNEPPKHSRRAALLERLLTGRAVSDAEATRLAGSRANLERLMRSGHVRPDRDGHSIELAISRDDALAAIASMRRTKRAEQACAIIARLDAEPQQNIADLRPALGVDTATVRWLVDIDAIELRELAVQRDPLGHMEVALRAPAELLPAQAAAAGAISAAIDGTQPRTFLLHGVTGSGKTEVYLSALDDCLARGKRAIVMVPEIALTPQTVRRFRERCARVAVLHSGLSAGELFDQWHGIARGDYDVVIGARSAIFAPQPDLALIVIDEEHEWTYKQHDPPPRYHARTVALELARLKGATVVLGSATPDVESYERAHRGEYALLTLPERIRPVMDAGGRVHPQSSSGMPQISVVDMRDELHTGNRSMFSRELRGRIDAALSGKEQVILFLNRRGLAGHVQCRDCGFVPQCASCAVALTYHRQYDRLVCHQCNRQQRLPAACRQCGSPRVRLVGVGVEKVESEAARTFPHARLLRWDRDVTRGRHAHEQILAKFLAHEADVLIGTQMLAKGLDLPSVTLVGVVNADVGLHLPDFRAGERTFQLLTQVAGRAGRGERDGHVVIQTYQPDHYAIDAAARYDYEGLAAAELESRRLAGYPPYMRLVRMTFTHPNARYAREEAIRVQRALSLRRAELGSDDEVVGPAPAYVPRVRGRWRWQLTIRGRDPASLVRGFVLPPNWSVDVDPGSLA
jgi:primosomal protein N' (replication factor Y)